MKLINFEDIEIKEYPINNNVKIAILRGGFSHANPKEYMDLAVYAYVEGCIYNEFIEEHLDNPWLRVVIKGINEIDFNPFNGQKLSDQK